MNVCGPRDPQARWIVERVRSGGGVPVVQHLAEAPPVDRHHRQPPGQLHTRRVPGAS